MKQVQAITDWVLRGGRWYPRCVIDGPQKLSGSNYTGDPKGGRGQAYVEINAQDAEVADLINRTDMEVVSVIDVDTDADERPLSVADADRIVTRLAAYAGVSEARVRQVLSRLGERNPRRLARQIRDRLGDL